MADAGGNIAAREAAWWADWRARDFSWDGLAAQATGDGSLQDYWRNQQHSLIHEPGTQRRWTRFHCPLLFADGNAFAQGRVARRRLARPGTQLAYPPGAERSERPCRLDGCVLRRMDEGADDAGEAYLWLSARWAWFGEGVDLRNNSLGLSDFQGACSRRHRFCRRAPASAQFRQYDPRRPPGRHRQPVRRSPAP